VDGRFVGGCATKVVFVGEIVGCEEGKLEGKEEGAKVGGEVTLSGKEMK
jgi:hypothetical protein